MIYCGFGIPRQTYMGDPSWPADYCRQPESEHVPASAHAQPEKESK